jgi:hypothetical protein
MNFINIVPILGKDLPTISINQNFLESMELLATSKNIMPISSKNRWYF